MASIIERFHCIVSVLRYYVSLRDNLNYKRDKIMSQCIYTHTHTNTHTHETIYIITKLVEQGGMGITLVKTNYFPN